MSIQHVSRYIPRYPSLETYFALQVEEEQRGRHRAGEARLHGVGVVGAAGMSEMEKSQERTGIDIHDEATMLS